METQKNMVETYSKKFNIIIMAEQSCICIKGKDVSKNYFKEIVVGLPIFVWAI